ncbi:hypothetical protein [Streptomyces sp. NPDC058308]|uniref:hypothetical protein n=1 Tax=Streptomyces sp. NPDC058308 TaxID=3346440 RepID=UPI0036E40B26
MEPETKRKLTWAAGTAGAAIFTAALLWGPWVLESDRIRDKDGTLAPSAGIIITGLRTALIAIVGGIIASLGLWYTHKKHQLDQQQFEANLRQFQEQFQQSQEQFRLAQQQFMHTQQQFEYEQEKDRQVSQQASRTRITEGYVTAVELLGQANLTARLGALYNLQRIARESPEDRDGVLGVLRAFRRHRQDDAAAAEPGAHGGEDLETVERIITVIEGMD